MDADRPDELTTPTTTTAGAGARQRTDRAWSSAQVRDELEQLERTLEREDPLLAGRFRRLGRQQRRTDLAVFALLGLSVLLLAAALATNSAVAWLTGATAFLASFVVDTRHHRTLERSTD